MNHILEVQYHYISINPSTNGGDTVAKWAYLPIEETKEEDTLDEKIQELEDEIERFKCAVHSHTVAVDKFSDQLGQIIHQYTEGDPDKCRRRSCNDDIKTPRDDTPESSVSGPEGKVSIDELGKIFSRLMQNKEFREAYERATSACKKGPNEETEWDDVYGYEAHE